MGALGHDAGHFAASRRPWVNEWGVWAMSFICNPVLWQHQHTYGHHSFTNEFGHDPDLHHFDKFIRVHKRIKYQYQFRYQSNWLYVMLAYLFVVFGTCFFIPWGVLSTNSLYGIIDWSDQNRPGKYFGMQFHLALYIFTVALVPLFMHESFISAACAVYLHIGTLGLTFALFSQINHLNEPSLQSDLISRRRNKTTIQPSSNQPDARLIHSWAAAQVETSNNFASQSMFWHLASNGLNHQIEHHLFPGLNHCHLHHIAPVVKATCMEFGVQYKSYDTWNDLMNATLAWFDELSHVE
jgi:fatty acid desaturase